MKRSCLQCLILSIAAGTAAAEGLAPLPGLTKKQETAFEQGRRLFELAWPVLPEKPGDRAGLGPYYHASSCIACHPGAGRGLSPDAFDPGESLVFRVGVKDEALLDAYGAQLSPLGVPGVEPEGSVEILWTSRTEKSADGTSWTLRVPHYKPLGWNYGNPPEKLALSPRLAPALHGMGLLEAVTDDTLLGMADPDDKNSDGISGRVNLEETWEGYDATKDVPGRFGWKAWMPTLLRQVCGALGEDMGITNYFNPHDATPMQEEELHDETRGGRGALFEAKHGDPERLTDFVRFLPPPVRRDPDDPAVRAGEGVFLKLNCQACHTPDLKTGRAGGVKALAEQTIHPFTDLLLHDMGPDLADGRPEAKATGVEWRTAPLWGLSAAVNEKGEGLLLHDGRARTLEEAILWHGGEAEKSREAWRNMNAADRAALVKFLRSL
jgi:CxxC motif-containing protein (DUF1111 family)